MSRRREPQCWFHTLGMGICDEFLHLLITYIIIPPVVDKNIVETELCSEVDIFYLILIIDAVILPEYPAPCSFCRSCGSFCLITWIYKIPGKCCLGNRSEIISDGHYPPGSITGKRYSRFRVTVAVVLLCHRESNRVASILEVAEMSSAIITVDTRFGDQCPDIVRSLEEGRICVSPAVLRGFVHRGIYLIILLITGFGAFPADHRVRLGREKCCRAFRERKRTLLFQYPHRGSLFLARYTITVSHTVISDMPFHIKSAFVSPFVFYQTYVGIYVDV